ncbi:MAG: RnfABCDGE type electron transport complex subunit C [Deltaproteobacteria bacterium]|nr:MAG: RnfABCDGE type electron transport complex subunit C [Deltaproteobacteria bacterium]
MEIIRSYGGLKFQEELPSPEKPIEDLPPPKNLILPLSDLTGISSRPLVQRGESVFKGEKVGQDLRNRMTPTHSSVSGRVTGIDTYRFVECGNVLSIFIQSDGRERWKTKIASPKSLTDQNPSSLVQQIKESGVQIIPSESLPQAEGNREESVQVEQFVINGIGQGYAGSMARRLMVELTSELHDGIRLIKRVFRPKKIFLAVNDHHEDVIRAIDGSGLNKEVDVIKLDVYYPLGHPHLLFKRIFDREIPAPGGSAIDMGVAFIGVDRVIQVSEAVLFERPMIEQYVTVSGEGVHTPKNLKVRIGTPLRDLINFCGGFKGDPGRIVLGNPLGGIAQFSLERPVLKDTRWLWVQPEAKVVRDKYRPCINCGDCVDICPVHVMPNFLGKFCEFCKYEEAAQQYDLFSCIECGLCSYVCPSRRPMVHFIKMGKWELSLIGTEDGKRAV